MNWIVLVNVMVACSTNQIVLCLHLSQIDALFEILCGSNGLHLRPMAGLTCLKG